MRPIFVDLNTLGQVYQSLNGVRADLEGFGPGLAAASVDALGSDRVAWAFDDFVHGWRDGRERVMTEITNAAAQIEAAVDAYSRTENRISSTARHMRGGSR